MIRIFDTTLNSRGLQKCCGKAFAEHAKNQSKTVSIGQIVTCPECHSDIALCDDSVWRKVLKRPLVQNSVITGIECDGHSEAFILRGKPIVSPGDLMIVR